MVKKKELTVCFGDIFLGEKKYTSNARINIRRVYLHTCFFKDKYLKDDQKLIGNVLNRECMGNRVKITVKEKLD